MAAFGSGIKKELWVSIQGERAMRDKAKKALVAHKKAQTRLEAAKRKAEAALVKEGKAAKRIPSLKKHSAASRGWGMFAFGKDERAGLPRPNAQIIGRRTFGPADLHDAQHLSFWRKELLSLDRALVIAKQEASSGKSRKGIALGAQGIKHARAHLAYLSGLKAEAEKQIAALSRK